MNEHSLKEIREFKRKTNELIKVRNREIINWAIHKIATYEDLLVSQGHDRQSLAAYYTPERLAETLSKPMIMDYFYPFILAIEQEQEGIGKNNLNGQLVKHEYEGYTYPTIAAEKPPIESNIAIVSDANVCEPSIHDDNSELKAHETLPESEKQKCKLYPFQERNAAKIYYAIVDELVQGQQLRGGVGIGKTYIIGAVIRRLVDIDSTKGKTYSPWPRLYVTKSTLVEQTERVFRNEFGLNTSHEVKVINIEQLRSMLGERMVRHETIIERGEELIKWKWCDGVHPVEIFWDENQILKNTHSQQSQIAQGFNAITNVKTTQVFLSATPWMRVCEAMTFAVSTRHRTTVGFTTLTTLTNDNWSIFARAIAHPDEPEEYSPAAIERLMKELDRYIVQVKGVRAQFRALNSTQLISFKTAEEREFYQVAWTRYEEMKRKIEGFDLSGGQSRFLILAQFTIFRKAAELCRAPYLAEAMYESVQRGQAAVLAANFKGTISRVVEILHDKYGVDRDSISLIWGGSKTKKTKKQEDKELLMGDSRAAQILREMGITAADLGRGDVNDYIDDDPDDTRAKRLRLGTQSKVERQKEIDRFQSGRSLYCCFTFKAGGVGLSLHHSDERTKIKCRRTRHNWAVVEDIPKVPTRQRVCFLAPTFSAIELVQGLGRCPRLTSLSDTPQVIVFYSGTIEERVAAIVNLKLKCLTKVVAQKEDWQDTIIEANMNNDTTTLIDNGVKQLMDNKPTEDNDDIIYGGGEDDEDDD